MNLGGMILDISPYKLAEQECSISSQGCCGGAPIEISQFTAYTSYAIELKIGRMLENIGANNRSGSDYPVSPRDAVGRAF